MLLEFGSVRCLTYTIPALSQIMRKIRDKYQLV